MFVNMDCLTLSSILRFLNALRAFDCFQDWDYYHKISKRDIVLGCILEDAQERLSEAKAGISLPFIEESFLLAAQICNPAAEIKSPLTPKYQEYQEEQKSYQNPVVYTDCAAFDRFKYFMSCYSDKYDPTMQNISNVNDELMLCGNRYGM